MSNTRYNEKTEVICEYTNAKVEAEYFWDSHGDLIDWSEYVEEPTSWSNVEVKLVRYYFTEHLLGKDFDFETLQLIVDGRTIGGDVLDYVAEDISTNSPTIKCKIAVGWG